MPLELDWLPVFLQRSTLTLSSALRPYLLRLGGLGLAGFLWLIPLGLEATPPVPEGPLRVYLLSIDRGDEVYEMFGHNALLIQNTQTGEALAWNWGLFNFEDVDFIPRFLRGTMRYSMGPADPDRFLQSYVQADRAVFAHRIHLTQEQASELDAFVRWNYLPENRPYIYDYYRDNCSTRVRDALDRVLGGVLRAEFEGVSTGRSYRWFSGRQVQETGWVHQGLSYLLGVRGDRPIDQWASMFLPIELMELLEGVYIEPASGDAASYPLLGPREVLVPSTRGPLPPSPPGPSLLLLALGLGAALVVTAGGVQLSSGRRGPRVWAMAGLVLLWGFAASALGLLLVASWWTDHHFIQANMNVFQTHPLILIPASALLMAVFRSSGPVGGDRGFMGAVALWVALATAALSVVGALAQGTSWLVQGNGIAQGNLDVLFVSLPLNLSIALALWMGKGRPSRFSLRRGLNP